MAIMTPSPQNRRTPESQEYAAEYQRQAGRVIDALSHAAIVLQQTRSSVPTDHVTGLLDHSAAAARVVKEIQNMVFELPVTALLAAATKADRVAREELERDARSQG